MAINYVGKEHYGTEVFHDMINKVLELVALNKNSHIPHEWYFIKIFIKEIEKNPKLAEKFVMYVAQYYPDYRWIDFRINDYVGSVVVECGFQQFQFQQKCDLGIDDGIFSDLKNAMLFGEIVTDFLIRCCGYSLIKSSNQNIIITSRQDCEKRFEDLLYQGYSLQRRERAVYTDISEMNVNPDEYPGIKGMFHRLRVLPIKEIDIPIDEMIELPNGQYQLTRQLTKPKYHIVQRKVENDLEST